MTTGLRILALDTSLTATGWAADNTRGEIVTGRIMPGAKRRDCVRLDYIRGELLRLLGHLTADGSRIGICAIEGPSYGSVGGNEHERGGLWWLLRLELWQLGVPVVVIAPHSVHKYATGKGVGDKPAVLAAAVRRFPQMQLSNFDEADALWLHAMTAERYGRETCDMPAVNRSAIYAIVPARKRKPAHPAIDWPDLTDASTQLALDTSQPQLTTS